MRIRVSDYNNFMTTTTIGGPSNRNGSRPLNMLKDLPSVADLVEECFKGNLDNEGQAAINNIRRRGRDNSFLSWAPKVLDSLSMPLSGFVWEEDGKIVGNTSLIPYFYQNHKVYLIANVATHPKYEGKGIASALTKETIAKAQEKGCDSIWLQVRSDNQRAIGIYERAGFIRKYERTTWQLQIGHRVVPDGSKANVSVINTMSMDWEALRQLYNKAYPKELSWFNQFDAEHLRPGFFHSVGRLLRDERVTQRSAFIDGKLRGGVSLLNRLGQSEMLLIAMENGYETELLPVLLRSMAEKFSRNKKLTFELPPSDLDGAIFDMGFTPKRVILWMKYVGV